MLYGLPIPAFIVCKLSLARAGRFVAKYCGITCGGKNRNSKKKLAAARLQRQFYQSDDTPVPPEGTTVARVHMPAGTSTGHLGTSTGHLEPAPPPKPPPRPGGGAAAAEAKEEAMVGNESARWEIEQTTAGDGTTSCGNRTRGPCRHTPCMCTVSVSVHRVRVCAAIVLCTVIFRVCRDSFYERQSGEGNDVMPPS